jgi:hypothetical protein
MSVSVSLCVWWEAGEDVVEVVRWEGRGGVEEGGLEEGGVDGWEGRVVTDEGMHHRWDCPRAICYWACAGGTTGA